MAVDWNDVEAIALLLRASYPDVNPSALKFNDLSEMILALPGVGGTATPLESDVVAAIQAAWFEAMEEDELMSAP
jgi:FeS assembly protein IscX